MSGNRRYLACRMAGYTHMDAIVLPAAGPDCTDRSLLMRLTREHLHYLEEADICHRLTEDGFTKEQLARCLGKTPALVAQKLRLAGLEPELRAFLMEQNLPEGYARALSKLPDRAGRMAIARQAVAQKLWRGRDVELLASWPLPACPCPRPSAGGPFPSCGITGCTSTPSRPLSPRCGRRASPPR